MPHDKEIRPRLRTSDARSISFTLATAVKEAFAHGEYPFENCITCTHFDEKGGEVCRLYKARPPARVIAYGCPSYVDFDVIPF